MKKIYLLTFLLTALSVTCIKAQDSADSIVSVSNSGDSQPMLLQNDSTAAGTQEIVSVSAADNAYINGDYITAAAMYEEIIATQGFSEELYLNLGNSYFQMDQIAKAILNYERAYKLDPSDPDVRFNLELARTRIVDKEVVVNEIFIVTWFKQLSTKLNLSQWGVITLVLMIVIVVGLAFMFLCRRMAGKKIAFSVSVIAFVCLIMSYCFAAGQKKDMERRNTAIIMDPSVTVKSTPNENGTDLFIIHDGRKVRILDAEMKDWVEIRLNDGNQGWVPVTAIEVI